MSAHWGVTDPAAVGGSDDEKRRAFKDAATALQKRIEVFTWLPTSTMDRMGLKAKLDEIGTTR